jgi:RHS repeat-associated protein
MIGFTHNIKSSKDLQWSVRLVMIVLVILSIAGNVHGQLTVSGTNPVCLTGTASATYSVDYSGSSGVSWTVVGGTIHGYCCGTSISVRWDRTSAQGATTVQASVTETTCTTVDDPPYEECGWVFDPYFRGEFSWECWWVDPEPYEQCNTNTYTSNTLNANVADTPSPVAFTNSTNSACEGSEGNSYHVTVRPVTYLWSVSGGGTIEATSDNAALIRWNTPGAQSVTIRVSNGNCTSSPTTTNVTVNALPNPFSVEGTQAICSGSTTSITLNGSQSGVNYQLNRDGAGGVVIAGTGSSLTWTGQNTAGVYSVMATNTTNGCARLMNNSATITLSSLPSSFTVGGTGPICSGSSTSVTLNGSQAGVNYQLRRDGANIGAVVAGTGSTLNWPGQNTFGSYTVMATNATTSCSQLMTGSLSVIVNALPGLFTVSGTGSICSGSSTTVTLNGSQTGVNYQLRRDGSNVGGAVVGTGSALNWPGQNIAGSFTVMATNATTSCSQLMTGSLSVIVNALPDLFIVGGTGPICSGSSTTVTLNGSQTGVNYQLFRDGSNVGGVVAGTGSALNWPGQNIAGSYTVMATNATTSCSQLMTGSLSVIVNALPGLFTVSGTGPICSGSSTTVTLNGSQAGVNYQLRRDGANIGGVVAGTGSTLNWPGQNTAGIFTVMATNTTNSCSQLMTGSLVISINSTPAQFTVSATSPICSGSSTTVTLNGSQTGVNYQLRRDGVNVGTALTGTGAALNWVGQNIAGAYSAVATTAVAGCTATMTGSSVVVVNSLPTLFTLSATGGACAGIPVTLSINGSQTGINYQLLKDGTAVGTAVAGTGSVLNWLNVIDAGVYTVRATYPLTGCLQLMTGTHTINPLPVLFTVGGTAAICAGSTTTVTLSGSQVGVNYQLRRDGTNVGTAIAGTGAALNWAGQNAAGSYTVMSTRTTGACTQLMTGSLILVVNSLPALFSVSGGGTICSGASGVAINLSGTQVGVNYQLKNGSTNVGASIAGTGSAINWPNQITAGSYTVVATNATSSCNQTMTGSVALSVNALPTLFTVGGTASICAGSTSTVTLSGSQSGVNYQLRRDGANVGTALAGTGAALNFAGQSTSGNYSVMATNVTTACAQLMTGSLNLVVNPAALAPVISGVSRCGTGTVTLTASSATTGAFKWYSALTGGSLLQTSPAGVSSNTYGPSVSATTTYYVTFTTSANCESSPRTAVVVTVNPSPTLFAVSGGGNLFTGSKIVSLSGSQAGVSYQLKNSSVNSGSPLVGTGSMLQWTVTQVGTFTVEASLGGCPLTMNGSAVTFSQDLNQIIRTDSLRSVFIPEKVKAPITGWVPVTTAEPQYQIGQLNLADVKSVFPAPPCLLGNYWVGFQLYYDLGDKQTNQEWLSQLTISLKQGATTLWTSQLQVNTKNQTFISTNFYQQVINCTGNYTFSIDQKETLGAAPQSNIYLKVLLYRDDAATFTPSTPVQLSCASAGNQVNLGWTYSGPAYEYDLEWVFIADHEGFTKTTALEAFAFKEPARITTAAFYYNHLLFFQKGRVWYRVRAVNYHPQNAEHRQLGHWSYTPCAAIAVTNPQVDRNWQVQTAFAEDGKSKKIVQYFDGTQRARQSQTNLSTENITITSETLYDFEGRKSVDILSAPSEIQYNNSLTFKPGLNNFTASDPLVIPRTSATREKYHYDNLGAENSVLNTSDGAGRYFSPTNTRASTHRILIPNGEGYVYSQTEYLNDGTGRVKRQSGVGREFRMDGNRTSRYFYGGVAPAELIRLFGNNNVGNASHYKKNLVVDANGQVSVSYLDQFDQVIATALAGEKPTNLSPLPSFTSLSTSPITVDITNNNQRQGPESITTHKILNTAPNTPYVFNYDLTATNPSDLGCPSCVYDITINITRPNGELLELGPTPIPGNQSANNFNYVRNGFSAAGCAPGSNNVQISVTLGEIGDYTITKKLVVTDLLLEALKTTVKAQPSVQLKIQQITDAYNQIDYNKCVACTTQPALCSDAENAIIDAFNKVALVDCENIVQQIKEDLRKAHLVTFPDDFDYEPTPEEIRGDARYCRYELCIKDKESDVFEKQMARVANWSTAGTFANPLAIDPFFNNAALSGAGFKTAMLNRLNNFVPPTYDLNGVTPRSINSSISTPRPIDVVVDPTNAAYYIDDNGNATNSNLVGRHILYMDLMGRKATMTTAAYNAELDIQRWALFKSFYQEAKRQTKLTIAGYSTNCPKAKEELQRVDGVPKTEQGVRNWADAKFLTDPVSDLQLRYSFYSIRTSCNFNVPTKISNPDSLTIVGHLRTYFDSNRSNFFRWILRRDLLSSNPSLVAINGILQSYGCDLNNVAADDPINCLAERRVFSRVYNKVHNSQFLNCTGFGAPLPDPDCGWAPVSGLPVISSFADPSQNYVTLKARSCDPNSDALRGILDTPLVPGRKYIFSVKSKPTDGNPNWKFRSFLEFSSSNAYNKITATSCTAQAVASPELQTQAASIAPMIAPPLPPGSICCTTPGVTYLDQVQTNGLFTDRIWDTNFLFREAGWRTYTKEFIASAASSNFVFSIISQEQLSSSYLSPYFSFGNFENIGQSTTEIFQNTNNFSYGSIDAGVGVAGSGGLSIRLTNNCPNPNNPSCPCPNPSNPDCPPPCPDPNNPSCPCPNPSNPDCDPPCDPNDPCPNPCNPDCGRPCPDPTNPDCFCIICPIPSPQLDAPALALSSAVTPFIPSIPSPNLTLRNLADFYSISDGQTYDYYVARIWIKTPNSSYISTNPFAQLRLSVIGGESSIVSTTTVTLQSTNETWTELTLQTSVMPSRVSLMGFISTNEVNAAGVLRADQFNVIGYRNPAYQAIDIKDVSIIEVVPEYDFTYCTEYQQPVTPNYLSDFTIACRKNLEEEAVTLRELAIDEYLEDEITTYSNTYKTRCMEGANENFRYSFKLQEYHYTLYYYDQARNLVQTVPPEGVKPLTMAQVNAGAIPAHTLVTRYQYNSLNQLIRQNTPDAGESRFWYDDKAQLRLSQNARQMIDKNYSYTKYDVQGRVTEVGELTTTNSEATLTTQLERTDFPKPQTGAPTADTYVLTDITRTYYDLPNTNIQTTFSQQQLRNRVSWVEMLEKGKPDPVLTFYSYDIHGNVRSLLQQLPGLQSKRTDYLYDLVSGKVNFVMYQFGQPDQLAHRYEYDADNRIREVLTSTDRFIWDRDARYQYYLHGPLARAELAQYNAQGLDYYYTLQGWLKGVNSPTGANAQNNDPSRDGIGTSTIGRDAFAYNLGYYLGDYAPIGAATPIIVQTATTAPWPWQGAAGERLDLYNGNIAWMATDLEIIGTNQSNRNAGVQLMQYTYDQLNRIVRGRSRTYNGSLVARTTTPAAYDEDYTYDANGNILTLVRRNQLAAVQDNFIYQYYAGTNRLRGVRPITEDVVYTGAVTSNTKIYRNITLSGGAYVPTGANVVMRATQRITASPNFVTTGAGSFRAFIPTEGSYEYDAIGNLIFDRHEGAAISWTPYGKVRQVKTKGDSVVTDFLYDASGNRVEKRVVTLPKTGPTTVAVTRYVRDASGNIMSVYQDDEVPDVQWTNLVGVAVSGTTITKTVATSAWDAGLSSMQKIPAGVNGWVQTTLGSDPTNDRLAARTIGLSATDGSANLNSIQYGLYLENGVIRVYESGTLRSITNSFVAGDVVRVERLKTTVYYKKNGAVFYTSTIASATDLVADFSFFHVGGRLLNVEFNFGEAPTEQPLYGSSRLGQYMGWRKVGQRRLGRKQFELTNHLGNVLAVITDNANITPTSASATVVSATDYYPFGLEMTGRSYQNEKYRYGFNGKEKDNSFASGNSYDYGFRIYNPRIAKFLATDPLTKSYPTLTPYQFAGNNPIAMVDVDGLEPATVNPGTQTLVFILQGYGGDPPNGNTQSDNAPGLGRDNALGSIFSTGTKLQVIHYASSSTDNTKTDVLTTIQNFRTINPSGKVIIVGHSGGGDNAIELAKENPNVKINLLITLDTQDPKPYGIDDNNISKNVENAINYYQNTEGIGNETLDFSSTTKGANILSPGSNHRSIDNDQRDNVVKDINNLIKGKDVVTEAKKRVQTTNNPAASGSPDIGGLPAAIKNITNPKSTRD